MKEEEILGEILKPKSDSYEELRQKVDEEWMREVDYTGRFKR